MAIGNQTDGTVISSFSFAAADDGLVTITPSRAYKYDYIDSLLINLGRTAGTGSIVTLNASLGGREPRSTAEFQNMPIPVVRNTIIYAGNPSLPVVVEIPLFIPYQTIYPHLAVLLVESGAGGATWTCWAQVKLKNKK